MGTDPHQTDWVGSADLHAPSTRSRAIELRDDGIRRAVEHADALEPSWSERAYTFFCGWLLGRNEPFQTCEARWASEGIVPPPPDARAWGHVARRAALAGKIVAIGTAPDLDPKSHRSPCNVWRPV